MSDDAAKPSGPQLAAGIALDDIADGAMLQGHANGEAVLLARRGNELFAVGALCTHYHGPLAEGLMVGDTVRCPWHHACFSLRTGEAVRAPAFDPLPRWRIQRQGDKVFVRDKQPARARSGRPKPAHRLARLGRHRRRRRRRLRRGGAAPQGCDRPVTLLSADDAPALRPPSLSGLFAGTARRIPLRSSKFYEKRAIDLR
jgi:nitrite reductase/ring-hydroxylating ferredoxin subunit